MLLPSRRYRNLWCAFSVLALLGGLWGRGASARPAQTALTQFSERVWHIQDGMPSQVIRALAQTPDHYLWIGTEKELLRFDGASFAPYTGTGVEALRHGVASLMVARDGSLYIGTEGSGLLHYDHGRMEVFAEDKGLSNLFIRATFQDAQGRIWVGSDGGIFQVANGRLVRVEMKQGCHAGTATSFVQEANGDVLSGGIELLRFHDSTCTPIPLPHQKSALRILALHLDAQGSLWVGTFAGLLKRDLAGRFSPVPQVKGAVRCFGALPNGSMWVGTLGQGLYLRQGSGFQQMEAPERLPSNTVLAALEDAEGNLWIGTQSGLLRMSRSGIQLTELPGPVDADFASLLHDEDGSFWICSSQVFRTKAGVLQPYRIAGMPDVVVRALYRDHQHNLWIGTAGMGVFRVTPRGVVEHYFVEVGNSFIRGFYEGRDGAIWIATEGGIARYANGKTVHYRAGDKAPHSFVFSLAEDRQGALWVGTSRGLYLFRNGGYEPFAFSTVFQGHSVYAVYADEAGSLWVGADDGLFRVRGNTVFHFPPDGQNGFPTVYQILREKDKLWVAAPTQVFRWQFGELNAMAEGATRTPHSRQVFPIANELQSAEIQGGYLVEGSIDQDGSAWFASSRGLVHLLPWERHAMHDVPLAMQRILVDGVDRGIGGVVTLPPGTRSVEFNFAPVLLGAQDGLDLRVRLQGFDDWHTAPSSRSAIYTNLPPGRYVLQLKNVNADGVSGHELDVTLIQTARFYRQTWFWCLCAVFLVILSWSIHRLRLERVRIRFAAIASERARIAREMHDTLLQECIGISSLLEAHAINRRPEQAPDTLIDYARNRVSSLIEEVRRVMMNLRVSEQRSLDLEESLRTLVEQQSDPSGDAIEFVARGKLAKVKYRVGNEILMSTREALLNAIAHSRATRIRLSLEQQPAEMTVTVQDNGVGFLMSEAATVPGHFGLKGMEERMAGVGGTLTIETEPGKGTLVVLRIPVRGLRAVSPLDPEF